MTDRMAGERLKRYVLTEAAQHDIHSTLQLAEEAGVGRDTLHGWWRGRPPSPAAGEKIARAIGKSYRDLLVARAGEPEPEPMMLGDEDVERIARRTAELLRQELGLARDRGRGGSKQT